MKYVLALDQGTTSSRAILFDGQGAIVSVAQREFRQIFPQPGWVEHDPDEIWRTQLACARRAIRTSGVAPADVAAIGISNQRETVVVWDRQTGQPVHNAIVWQDRRTADRCTRLKQDGMETLIRQRTGLMLDPYFSASKIAWILDSIPGMRLHAERGDLAFGTIDTWLAWKLTDGQLHVTDPSNASRTMLYDIHLRQWDDELLALFRIPRAMLPAVYPSAHAYGQTIKRLFGASIPIGGMAGDQQAALFGQACHAPGMAKNTYGTGCFMLLNTGKQAIASTQGLLTTCAADSGLENPGRQYALEGSVFVGGAVVQWLRDGLGIIKSSTEVERLAGSVQDSGDVYVVPAFTGLGAPHWDPYARGAIVGLTRGTNRAHIARAALESIAFQSADLLLAMQRDAGIRLTELRADGGATANHTLMQFQADILGVPVVLSATAECTAMGAAYLAGLSAGLWKSVASISNQWRAGRRYEPTMKPAEAAARMSRWTEAVRRSRNWVPEGEDC
jgi:glycerol kinase